MLLALFYVTRQVGRMAVMATKYSQRDREKAAIAYLVHRNSKAAGKECGVPPSTIRTWTQTTEFQELLDTVRDSAGDQARARIRRLLSRALDEVQDRLNNGNVVRDRKSGAIVRVPVRARDCAEIAGMARDWLYGGINGRS